MPDTNRGKAFGYEYIVGVGIGIVYVMSYFPILAPIPVTQTAAALAFFTFLCNFALVRFVFFSDNCLMPLPGVGFNYRRCNPSE